MHYVIGDVHGCYDELMALLRKIESLDSNANIIFVGDFIDRGPQVDKVLEWCLENVTIDGKYQSVRGNHEQLALEWYEYWLRWWQNYGDKGVIGGLMPESDYDFSKWMEGMHKLTPEGLQPYMEFFQSLPFSKEVNVEMVDGRMINFRIVHASYDFSQEISKEEQEHINVWWRGHEGNSQTDDIVVHGHTPTVSSEYTNQIYGNSHPGMICYSLNDINVDGGCVYSKSYPGYPNFLCAIRLEDLKEIYSCSLEERFMNNVTDKGMADTYLRLYKSKYFNVENEYQKRLLGWSNKCKSNKCEIGEFGDKGDEGYD